MTRKHGNHLEDTVAGRRIISTFVVILLGAMLVSVAPDSELIRLTVPFRQPITDVTGLSQNWNLFAPNPRASTLRLEARLNYADGTNATWSPPDFDRLVGAYRSFRWRKWGTNVMRWTNVPLRASAALYIAETNRRGREFPTHVLLVMQRYRAPAAGSGLKRDHNPAWEETILSSTRLSESGAVLQVLDFAANRRR